MLLDKPRNLCVQLFSSPSTIYNYSKLVPTGSHDTSTTWKKEDGVFTSKQEK